MLRTKKAEDSCGFCWGGSGTGFGVEGCGVKVVPLGLEASVEMDFSAAAWAAGAAADVVVDG